MRFFSIFVVFNLLCFTIHAQVDRDQQPTTDLPGMQITTNRLYGKLIDKKSGRGIEAASVQIYHAGKDSIVSGMLSKANGDFSFMDIPAGQEIKIIISAIGYTSFEQVIAIGAQNKIEKDLGNIELEPDIQVLGGVTVTANKPVLELGIDRKVYNVAKSLTSTGGSAIDVMKNIPSLKVDIDGNVQLRSSSPPDIC